MRSASVTCASGWALDHCGRASRGHVLQFLPQSAGIDAQFLRDFLRQFVADDSAWNALDVGQEMIHRLLFALGTAHGKLGAGAFDQVVEIFLRGLQRGGVGVFAFAADVEIGIETLLEGKHSNVKFFLHEETQRALRGLCSGCIRIEVDDNVLGESSQEFCLQLRERSPGTGDHIVKSGGIDGNAIHLAFDQDGVFTCESIPWPGRD